MRTIAAALGCLVVATAATASSALEVTVLPRPVFPAPVADLSSPGALTLVSSRYRSPADLTRPRPAPPTWAPDRFRGYELQFAIRQPPRGRNAYVSAIDLKTRKSLWRSPALVANAFTFILAGGAIVAGYGFTQEPDYLYLLDRRNGRVLDRLPMPTAPEIIKLRGDRLHVRTYDHDVVARIRG